MRANFALDYDVLTMEQPQRLYLMAYLTAGPAASDRNRRPLNLSLVIDRSGSMAGDKIEYTRQAAQLLVQNLGMNDTLSIVLYNDHVETLLPPERVQRKDVINQQIRNIKPGGTTNLSGGWLQGCGWVGQNLNSNALNRVILMTDGLANRGVTSSEKLVAMAQQKRQEGITTTTMGLGSDFNEDLLMQMANAGGGAFYFIESPEVTPIIFQEELQGLLSVVGQNLTISIDQSEHINEVRQLNAYPTSTMGRRATFRLGDVFGDEIKALLLELSIPALKEIGTRQIATLRFEYDELTEKGTEHRLWEMPVMVNVAPSHAIAPNAYNREVRRSVLLLGAAQARRSAVEAADKGRYADGAKFLRDAVRAIEGAGFSDPQLAEEQTALQKQAEELEKGAAAYDDYSRKSMSTQAFYTMSSRHEDTMVLRSREQQRERHSSEQHNAGSAGAIQPASPAALQSSPPPAASVVPATHAAPPAPPASPSVPARSTQTSEERQIDGSSQVVTGQFVEIPPSEVLPHAVIPDSIANAMGNTAQNPTPDAAVSPTTPSPVPGIRPNFVKYQGRVIALRGEHIRIGRANENELILPVKGVSRFHAELRRINNQWVLEDKGSTNGTTVNGKLISTAVTLKAGDEVHICDEKLIFLENER